MAFIPARYPNGHSDARRLDRLAAQLLDDLDQDGSAYALQRRAYAAVLALPNITADEATRFFRQYVDEGAARLQTRGVPWLDERPLSVRRRAARMLAESALRSAPIFRNRMRNPAGACRCGAASACRCPAAKARLENPTRYPATGPSSYLRSRNPAEIPLKLLQPRMG